MSDGHAPDLSALFEEARIRREREAADLALQHAAKEAEFMARLQRLQGGRTFRPGDAAGSTCPACGRSDVYDETLRIIHAPGGCVPRNAVVQTELPSALMERVRYTYDPSEDDD